MKGVAFYNLGDNNGMEAVVKYDLRRKYSYVKTAHVYNSFIIV